MLAIQFLYTLPIGAIFLITFLLLWLADEVGYRLGHWMQRRWPDHAQTGVGALVGAALALLGFMLAFTTGFAVNILISRYNLTLSQANAIGSTFLKTDFLEEPLASESRELLREYVDLRILALDPAQRDTAILRSEQIHQELWKRAVSAARKDPSSITALYISSLSEMIDLQTSRLNYELSMRVPPVTLLGLYLIAIVTLIMIGVHSSYTERRNLVALFGMILILSIVLWLIIDLDRSHQGLIQISQKALIDLQQQMLMHP